MGRTSLPPGFRFHPTDVELVEYYLKRKVSGRRIPFQVISEIDIYKFAPQDLPDKSCLKSKDLEWYFYCPRGKKYANGARMNRATESGFWKTTGKDRHVCYNEQTVGMIKTLVFHEGRPPRGTRTDWVMHEYRLEDKDLADTEVIQDYVLCKIFKKSGPGPKNGAQYGAPFNEEDWNDDVEINYAESLPLVALSMAAPVLPHIQNSSIVTSTIVPGSASSGFSSESGPSKAVQPPDEKLPSVPDDDDVSILELPDDFISMSDLLKDCGTPPPSNENDKSEEVDKVNHEGNDDIFDGLEDLNDCKLAELYAGFTTDLMSTGDGLFLHELESPMKCPAEKSSSQVNPDGTVNHSMINQSLVLPEGSCGFKDHLDLFQKENRQNEHHGYQEYEAPSSNANVTLFKQSQLEGRHIPQVQTRGAFTFKFTKQADVSAGEQQRKYSSRLQHLLESIPARPASGAEHPDPVNGATSFKGSTLLSSYGCSSIHVKAEVTLGGGGCTKDALSDKLEEFPCMCCYGCNLPRRYLRKEAADCGNGFTFVFFLGIFLALIWISVGAVVITKLGRYAWSLALS